MCVDIEFTNRASGPGLTTEARSRGSETPLPSLGKDWASRALPPEPRSRGGARDRAGPEARVFAVWISA